VPDNADEQTHLESGTATEADKSAVGAINRPLRLAGWIRESALSRPRREGKCVRML